MPFKGVLFILLVAVIVAFFEKEAINAWLNEELDNDNDPENKE